MNPGSPAPQAGVLSWLDYGPRQALPGKGLWPEAGLISSIGRFRQEALALYRVLHFFDARVGALATMPSTRRGRGRRNEKSLLDYLGRGSFAGQSEKQGNPASGRNSSPLNTRDSHKPLKDEASEAAEPVLRRSLETLLRELRQKASRGGERGSEAGASLIDAATARTGYGRGETANLVATRSASSGAANNPVEAQGTGYFGVSRGAVSSTAAGAAPHHRHSGGDDGRNGRSLEGLMLSDDALERLSLYPLQRIPSSAPEGEPLFLLQTFYDGRRGVAAAKLYEEKTGTVYVYYDKTGYKPYFLTDIPPDKLQEVRQVVKHPGFDHVEVVEKFDLLRWQSIRATKIVVKTPDVVPALRDKVPRAWEANIKFHHNYIYDRELVPGMVHVVKDGKLAIVPPQHGKDEEEKIKKIFEGEDESTIEMAVKWYPLFEQPPPRPRRIAVDIEVYTPFKGRIPDANKASYPVISVAFASDEGLRAIYVLSRPGLKAGKPVGDIKESVHVEIFDDERALILETFRLLANYPVVLTFNGDKFDFAYLYNRALKLGIPREAIPFKIMRDYITLNYGVHIDLYQFFTIKAVQTYAFGNAYKEFTLEAVSSALLGEHKVEVESTISDLSLLDLIRYNVRDAELTLKLTTFNGDLVWKLMILLMRISKLPLEDVTRSQVSAWVKSLLFWEHRRRGYLIPTRDEIIRLKGRTSSSAIIKGKKYQGAVVLDPPSGIFFDIVVLDYASLYPSIIKRWNLSYETVNPVYCPRSEIVEVPDVGHKVCKSIPGLTAQVVGLLRDYRVKIYKKRAKDKSLPEDVRTWYNTVQAAMKVYINASYGVFGAESFPFYAPPLAESVTAIGRFVIRQSLKKAAELGLFVLYGDTDSLFLWHPDRDKLRSLQEYVNEKFGLDIEVDKTYRFVTFSGLKKNYIGVYEDGSVDVKGLVAKKRNTPEFLKKEFSDILRMIGSIESPEGFVKVREAILNKLRGVYNNIKGLEYNLDELAIKMALNKPIEAYTKNTPQHVKAAKQLAAAGVQVLPGDVISFVKVRGKEGVKPIQLARLPEIDVDKYVESMKSIFEQILAAFNVTWDEVLGSSRLESFFRRA